MTHRCPGPDCPAEVPDHLLMCRRHWFQVPLPLRHDVWVTWRNGAGRGRADHAAAMRSAVDALRGERAGE